MPNPAEPRVPSGWKSTQVYAMAAACLLVGVALGYLIRGSASVRAPFPAPQTSAAGSMGTAAPAVTAPQTPSLEDMKHMADKQAEPLLARLKTDPNNSDLLNQIAAVYKSTHQFKDAATYYQKAINANPKNVPARTDLATCLYYLGDVDGALAQLQESLRHDPKNPTTLFNLGMMRYQGKNDASGAITAWQQLLKLNPDLSDDKKKAVEKVMAEVQKRGTTK